MPESRHDHAVHTNEEVANFATVGDARGAAWLKTHADDLAKARQRLEAWSAPKPDAVQPEVATLEITPIDVTPLEVAPIELTPPEIEIAEAS